MTAQPHSFSRRYSKLWLHSSTPGYASEPVRDLERFFAQLVSNLAAEDFQVFDQNLPQKILYVGRDREPLSLLLLLDVSGSMQKYINQVGSVARQSLKFLRPAPSGFRAYGSSRE